MALKHYYLKPVAGIIPGWELTEEGSDKPLVENLKKSIALEKSIKLVKKLGGSLHIHGKDGEFKEERTYPRSADPKKSKG